MKAAKLVWLMLPMLLVFPVARGVNESPPVRRIDSVTFTRPHRTAKGEYVPQLDHHSTSPSREQQNGPQGPPGPPGPPGS
ncbi:MAG: hypothetical protein AB1631_29020, partial [Acidobacteriota bacterium]